MTVEFEGWTILELMGHRRLGGYVRQQEIAGTAFLRIDVPGAGGQPAATQFYAPAAVYCLTPTTEELARQIAVKDRPAPVSRWELPAVQPGPPSEMEMIDALMADDDSDDDDVEPDC